MPFIVCIMDFLNLSSSTTTKKKIPFGEIDLLTFSHSPLIHNPFLSISYGVPVLCDPLRAIALDRETLETRVPGGGLLQRQVPSTGN